MTISQKSSKSEFKRLSKHPSIKEALTFTMTNGDSKKYDPTKLPSLDRVDAIVKACTGALRKQV